MKLTNPENGIIRTRHHEPDRGVHLRLSPAGHLYSRGERPWIQDNAGKPGSSSLPGDTLNMGISLTVGATEQVTVNATGPLLQTQDANISTELTNKQIEELPLNLRNVLSFATLDSAVNVQGDRQLLAAGGSEDTADQDYSFLNFGGGYFGTNLFLLEGGYDTCPRLGRNLVCARPGGHGSGQGNQLFVFSRIRIQHRQRDQHYHQGRHQQLPFPCRRILSATRTWTPTFTSTIWPARPGPTTIAISLGSPAADRCISRASTNSGTKPSFSPTMRACGSTGASAIAHRCPPLPNWGATSRRNSPRHQLGTDCLWPAHLSGRDLQSLLV